MTTGVTPLKMRGNCLIALRKLTLARLQSTTPLTSWVLITGATGTEIWIFKYESMNNQVRKRYLPLTLTMYTEKDTRGGIPVPGAALLSEICKSRILQIFIVTPIVIFSQISERLEWSSRQGSKQCFPLLLKDSPHWKYRYFFRFLLMKGVTLT